jgi:hypothetical protein
VSAADDFQANAEALAVITEKALQQLHADLLVGLLEAGAVTIRMAAQLNRANAAAASLGDAYVVSAIEQLVAQPTTAVGLVAVDESERLVKAVTTVLGETTGQPDTEARLSRLAHGEVFSTAQTAAVDAMTAQPRVRGWVRQFESAKPCELCVYIARDGRIWPKNHPFQVMHPGDKCVPRPVLTDHITPTRRTSARR